MPALDWGKDSEKALSTRSVKMKREDTEICRPSVINACPPGDQYMRTAQESNDVQASLNAQSNLCCIPTSNGQQKLVPLDVYGRPNIDRWRTTYHDAYNTYHDPRDGIIFNWKTEEEWLQEKAGCVGCQHGPTETTVPPLGTMNLCRGKIARSNVYARIVDELKCQVDPYNNLQTTRQPSKRVFKDVYGLPDNYRWKTEYDSSYNINPDGTWK